MAEGGITPEASATQEVAETPNIEDRLQSLWNERFALSMGSMDLETANKPPEERDQIMRQRYDESVRNYATLVGLPEDTIRAHDMLYGKVRGLVFSELQRDQYVRQTYGEGKEGEEKLMEDKKELRRLQEEIIKAQDKVTGRSTPRPLN